METTQTQLTHWKKNLDSRYISGEDLFYELHGLRKEMVVMIDKLMDAETFDQNTQKKKVVTGLCLKEMNGKELYKPVLLNNINSRFFTKESGSPFIEKWIGIPVIMFPQPDSRHGYVVRFKKYILPVLNKDTENFNNCYKAIHTNGFTMDQIRKKYQVSAEVEQLLMASPNE